LNLIKLSFGKNNIVIKEKKILYSKIGISFLKYPKTPKDQKLYECRVLYSAE